MKKQRRKVECFEGEGLDDAELNAPPSPATKVRARRELLEICKQHCPQSVPAVELLLAKAQRELFDERSCWCSDFQSAGLPCLPGKCPNVPSRQMCLPIPPNPKRKAEQLAFPFPAKFSPSPAGEGEPGSRGSGGRRPRAVREPSPRGGRAPQGPRVGAGSVLRDELGVAYALVLTRRRERSAP
jgi:hypothetical protein